MKQEQDIWVPITEGEPSDLLVCNYGGPFARDLQINRQVVDRFLGIASLDGRVLLKESSVKKPRAIPEINPDGSATGKRGLMWSEKVDDDQYKQNPYFQVEADQAGWVISINGGLILDDLTEKRLSVKKAQRPFVGKFNSLLRESLQQALLKDKCTFTKDPWLMGRLTTTLGFGGPLIFDLTRGSFGHATLDLMMYLATTTGEQVLIGDKLEGEFRRAQGLRNSNRPLPLAFANFLTMHRRIKKNMVEAFAPPFEIDRLARALGYMQWQRLTGQPLVRSAPN